jgi:Uma2 family endonuclease
MSTVSPPTSTVQRVVLHGVAWDEYTRLLWAFAERPSVRLTYDRGELEIMAPLYRHDNPSRFLGHMVRVLTEEFNLPLACGGSTTLRRRRRQRGLEADECFWIANEARIRGRRHVNLRTDPPPDLAIEVDVTNSSLNRMSIYAALQVPEVWRLDNGGLSFHVLQANGRFAPSPVSRSFPQICSTDLTSFFALLGQQEENEILRQFRAWVRQQVAPGGAGTPP